MLRIMGDSLSSRYIEANPKWQAIWKSIQNGPTPHPMVTDPPPANSTVMPAPRKKLDSEFNDEEKPSSGGGGKWLITQVRIEIILSSVSAIISKPTRAYMPQNGIYIEEIWSSFYNLRNDALMATLTQIANLLSGFQKAVSTPSINQIRTSSNSQKLMLRMHGWSARTTTKQVSSQKYEDAYDSDVDEGHPSCCRFYGQLVIHGAKTNSQVNEVHSNDNPNFDNVDYQLSQEMHQDEHLDSDAETEIDDNTIPYHQ
ncbi:hypothetical protein Tco_1440171 [Tanacetum coccineum]